MSHEHNSTEKILGRQRQPADRADNRSIHRRHSEPVPISYRRYLKKVGNDLRFKVLKSWCIEILRGLAYLHGQHPHPIIHRDLKCDNIFINSHNGQIVIGDLGYATHLSSITKNKSCKILGTPSFMAPEIFDDDYDVSPSIDIYSFGMCVLEMSTHQIPYSECKYEQEIYKHVQYAL